MLPIEQLGTQVRSDVQVEDDREAKQPGNISERSGTEAMILVVQFQNMTNHWLMNAWYLPDNPPSKVHWWQQSSQQDRTRDSSLYPSARFPWGR